VPRNSERRVKLTPEQLQQEESYKTARTSGAYDTIWQTVGRCVFCDHDTAQPQHEIYAENDVYMTVPAYAYIDGHLLVIPRRHIRSVKELTPLEWETMRKMFYLAKKMIRDVHGVKGMQIVQKDGSEAQSTVEHLHFHCVPFDGPDLSTWNYRELADTPYENAEKYRAQADKMQKLAQRFEKKYE
jgi:histidine triad (HIT) family protein